MYCRSTWVRTVMNCGAKTSRYPTLIYCSSNTSSSTEGSRSDSGSIDVSPMSTLLTFSRDSEWVQNSRCLAALTRSRYFSPHGNAIPSTSSMRDLPSVTVVLIKLCASHNHGQKRSLVLRHDHCTNSVCSILIAWAMFHGIVSQYVIAELVVLAHSRPIFVGGQCRDFSIPIPCLDKHG